MEGPLYGETTKQQKTLLYAMAIGLGILTIAAVLGCVIVAFMDKKFTHFILVIALVVLTAAIVLFVCLFFFLPPPPFFHLITVHQSNSGNGIFRSTSTPSSSGLSAFFSASLWSLTLPASSMLSSTGSTSPSPSPSGLFFAFLTSPFHKCVSELTHFKRSPPQQRSLQPEQHALLCGAQGQPALLRSPLILHVLQRCTTGVLRQLHTGSPGVPQEELDCSSVLSVFPPPHSFTFLPLFTWEEEFSTVLHSLYSFSSSSWTFGKTPNVALKKEEEMMVVEMRGKQGKRGALISILHF